MSQVKNKPIVVSEDVCFMCQKPIQNDDHRWAVSLLTFCVTCLEKIFKDREK